MSFIIVIQAKGGRVLARGHRERMQQRGMQGWWTSVPDCVYTYSDIREAQRIHQTLRHNNATIVGKKQGFAMLAGEESFPCPNV